MRTDRDDATRPMQAVTLLDLIDESAPEDGVVDIFALESTFARGTARIERSPVPDALPDGAVVEAPITAESTRRMTAVEWNEAMAASAASAAPKTTMQMPAVQVAELAASIAPAIEAPALVSPVAVPVEVETAPVEIAMAPARRTFGPWMIGGALALVAASAALVLVLAS